jgi:hypothetical protein
VHAGNEVRVDDYGNLIISIDFGREDGAA